MASLDKKKKSENVAAAAAAGGEPSDAPHLGEQVDKNVFRMTSSTYIGKHIRINTETGKNHAQIEAFWNKCREDGTLDALKALARPEAQRFAGACTNFGTREYDYWIGVEPMDANAEPPEGFERLEAEAGEYARFVCKGPAIKTVTEMYLDIYNRWFPKSTYNHGSGAELELYPFGDMEEEDYRTEILMPVRRLPSLAQRMPRRRNAMLGIIFVAAGLIAGMLVAGGSDKYLIYMLVGGALGYFVFAYIERRKEEREKKKQQDEASSGGDSEQ